MYVPRSGRLKLPCCTPTCLVIGFDIVTIISDVFFCYCNNTREYNDTITNSTLLHYLDNLKHSKLL